LADREEKAGERKKAVSATERLYEALLQRTSDAVLTVDLETWRIKEANPAALTLLNGHGSRLVDQGLNTVIHFKDRSFLEACRARLEAEEVVSDAVTYGYTRDGRELVLRFNLALVKEKCEAAFVQAVVNVVEEGQLLEDKTRPSPPDDFAVKYIPCLTHELNNHLAAVRLTTELAAATGKMPDFAQMQLHIDQCQEVLQAVILQILRLAAPVHTPAETPRSDLQHVIEHALLFTRPQVMTSSVQLELDLPSDLPYVTGFTFELQEALVRLILYSAKAMREHEPPRALSIRVEAGPEEVRVTMTDTGPGLTWRQTAAVNGRQTPGSSPEDRVWEIVREGLCRFGGSIQASNGLNGGARFSIGLPLAQTQKGSKR